jgi:hypothetical protein
MLHSVPMSALKIRNDVFRDTLPFPAALETCVISDIAVGDILSYSYLRIILLRSEDPTETITNKSVGGPIWAERCVHRPVEPDPGYTGVGNG